MEEILRTNDPTLIAFSIALLEGEGIGCFHFGGNLSVLDGNVGAFPQRLMVRREDKFRARAILRDNGVDAD